MSRARRLLTEEDFQEALDHERRTRVFQNDQLVGTGGIITRFDDTTIVIQSGVSDIAYYSRNDCEFFELR
ncbi:hypothetical protein EBB07_10090 [Paenibacillaceae bacterium]|nr:hypothetical protein EBB07_10090 [Paenibacillaceae bacterium]